jgi:diacylglycerol kinase (ATP)
MSKPGKTGLSRIIDATGYSIKGFQAAWTNEAAFRQELSLMLVMIPAAFWLGSNAVEYCLLIISCLLVVIVELLNSAIEAAIDRIGAEIHPLSGQAKDIASAAVFVSLCGVVLTWGLIAFERFA